jgi:hypothetical protein
VRGQAIFSAHRKRRRRAKGRGVACSSFEDICGGCHSSFLSFFFTLFPSFLFFLTGIWVQMYTKVFNEQNKTV